MWRMKLFVPDQYEMIMNMFYNISIDIKYPILHQPLDSDMELYFGVCKVLNKVYKQYKLE